MTDNNKWLSRLAIQVSSVQKQSAKLANHICTKVIASTLEFLVNVNTRWMYMRITFAQLVRKVFLSLIRSAHGFQENVVQWTPEEQQHLCHEHDMNQVFRQQVSPRLRFAVAHQLQIQWTRRNWKD
jgi:hypothetical protein